MAADDASPERIEELVQALSEQADPASLRLAQELVGAVLDLHRRGLERALQLLGRETRVRLGDDPRVARMLLLHELHPRPLDERVRIALEALERELVGGEVSLELSELAERVARVRVRAGWRDGATAWQELETRIEGRLTDAAPDLLGVQLERSPREPEPAVSFVPVADLLRSSRARKGRS